MVDVVYKNRATSFFKSNKNTREAAEKLFMKIKKKEPVFVKHDIPLEEFPPKDVNEDIKIESKKNGKWEPWDDDKEEEIKVNAMLKKYKEGKNENYPEKEKEITSSQLTLEEFVKKAVERLEKNKKPNKLNNEYDSKLISKAIEEKKEEIITKKMIWDAALDLIKTYMHTRHGIGMDNSLLPTFYAVRDEMPILFEALFKSKMYLENHGNEKVSNYIPAVDINKSIHTDYIICLEDGHKCKMLKPYIKRFGHTPESYIEKWSLPEDYPFTAPTLVKKRSESALKHKMWERNDKWQKGNRKRK